MENLRSHFRMKGDFDETHFAQLREEVSGLRTDIQVNYDAKQGQFLEQRYSLGWTGSCYGITIAPRRFLIYDRTGVHGRWGYDFGVSLKNVGSFGNLR